MKNENKPEDLSDFAKLLYNIHLKVSRTERGNKPYRFRKDFSVIDPTVVLALQRLENFFQRHGKEVDIESFFRAPYVLYPDVNRFDLDYYSSMRGIRSYTLFKQQQEAQSMIFTKDRVKESLTSIAIKCIGRGRRFPDYMKIKTKCGVPLWLQDVKSGETNVYALLGFPNFSMAIQSVDDETFLFFLGEPKQNFLQLKTKYNQDADFNAFLQKTFYAISEFVDEQLTKTQNNLKSKTQ